MKTALLFPFLFALTVPGSQSELYVPKPADGNPAQGTATGCTLRIHVDGLRNAKGKVGSVIFKSPGGWPEDPAKAFRRGPTDISPTTLKADVDWENLPPGKYGVALIHDENSNRRLDRNLVGIPKEGFGFANNPHVGLSTPPFSAAITDVKCPITEINIHMQYKMK
jgi:uncharacterized protein (DUF2141 family)